MAFLSATHRALVAACALAAAMLAAAPKLAAGPVPPHRVALATTVPEYELKAVFLFNFAQFVDWPPAAFSGKDDPLVIGILGDDPFGPYIDDVVRGERVKGRSIVVRRFRDVDEIDGCQILFIGPGARLDAADRRQLAERPVLTVSDAGPASVAIIEFVNRRNRIRLRIDAQSADAAGLTISSKLLRAAEIVRHEEG